MNIFLKWQTYEVSLFNNDEFIVENIENLTWGNSELSLTTNPYIAGDNVANVRAMPRDIIITMKPTKDKGDYSYLVHKLGRLFNKEVMLLWKDRVIPANMELEGEEMQPLVTDVQISGIVNEFDAPRFDDSVRIQMTIHCSNPFWEAVEEIESGIPDVGSIVVCPYTEVDCGLTIGFVSGSYSVSNQTFVLQFDYQSDDVPPIHIELKRRTTDGVVSVNNLYATFAKGKVEIYQIVDGNKLDLSDFFTFRVLRGELIGTSPTTWQMEEVNELPAMFPSSVPAALFANYNNSQTNGVIVWKPLFL